MKIANKISLSFFAVVLILMIIAGTIFYLTAKDGLQKSIYNNLTAVIASRTDHIETYLKMLKTSVGQLSRSITLMDFLKISDKESPERNDAFLAAMKRLESTKEANPAIAEFLLMDKRGLVAASSSESSIGLDKSADPIFLIGQKEIHVKDVYFSEVYKEPLMAVSAPIPNSVTGELSGVLAARVRLNDLNDIVANRTGMGETGEIYIVNKYGYMITPSRFDKGTVLKQKVDSEAVRHALLHKDRAHLLSEDVVVGVYPDYRGVPTLGAHGYIPRMRWAVMAEIDAKEAFRPLAIIRLIFILILFIVPIAGWLLGMFIAGIITRSLQKLRKGAEIIGSGNLDYKVGTAAKDEVGQLSRAFDTMTRSLKLTTVSIDNLNKEITERRQAEEKLKESGERFRAIFNTTFQFTGLMTPDGTLIEANQAAVDFTGLKLEDVANRPFWETHWWMGNEERVQKLKESIRLAASGEFIRYETELQGAGDATAYFDFSIKPVFGPNGKVTFLIPEGRDITERKKAEEERERMLKIEQNIALLQQWLLMSTTLDKKLKTITEGIVRIFDADFCRIWLIRPGDLCEKGCIHAEAKEGPHVCRYRDKCLHLMASSGRYTHTDGKGHARVPFDCYKIGIIASGEEHKFLTNDVVNDPRVHNHEWTRELGLVSFAGYQIRVPDGETIGVLALFAKHPISPMEDATLDNLSSSVAFIVEQASVNKELEESRHLLIQSSKMAAMGQLAAGISHELNQPLTGIKGFTQAVLMDLKKESPIRDDLNKIVEQTNRMDAIIKNVRFFSRKSDFNMTEIDINQVILNSLMLLSQQLKTHNIRVIQELGSNIPKIKGDPNQLQQAFLNIISNARDAIISLNRPEGGEIRIHTSLSRDKGHIEIIFRDTGCGVSEANLQHIFSPFYTTKSPDRGMGLGLSITYRIIENHQGEVKFESEEGEGATFRIDLPIKGTEDETGKS